MRAIARRRDVFIAELWGHFGNAASVRGRRRDAAEIHQKRPRSVALRPAAEAVGGEGSLRSPP
ncbi:hypothetical protein SNOUR_10950 [Streptomyces noursei ATCC 11455]|nr:hypothetical protein SNOUR_10950 [Streptomyces noursei ATCC 11455]